MLGRTVPAPMIFLTLIGFAVGGVGVLVWLAPVADEHLTPAQSNLISIADWIIKASVGAILGFAGGIGMAARTGRGE